MRYDMEQTKKCAHCGAVKPVSDFYINNHASDGRQSWCKDCVTEYTKKRNPISLPRYTQPKINLEPYKKDILIYRKTHTIQQTADWITTHYGIKCGETTCSNWLSRWEAQKNNPVIITPAPAPQPEAATLTDFNDADIIQELRKRGYRVFSERYIKRWGNHYKKQLIEITQ